MQDITLQETETVGGSGAVTNWIIGKVASWAIEQVLAGHVDYSSIAEQQGTYYNMVGA